MDVWQTLGIKGAEAGQGLGAEGGINCPLARKATPKIGGGSGKRCETTLGVTVERGWQKARSINLFAHSLP